MIAAAKNIKTGTEWMPIVPEHWQMIRVKNLFNEIDKRSVTGKEDLLSVSQYTGVTLRKDSFEEGKEITNAKTLKGYKIVEQGDLVVNIMLAWNGCLGISSYNGITSPAYCVYRVKNEQELNPEYFGYLFSTSLYKGEFRKRSTGIIESRLRLYSDAFFRIFCFVPPKEEQDKIVNLINSESAKITRFIQTKQRFIELLKEQRQSIIDEILNPEQEGWSWLRLKNVATVNDETIGEETDDNFILQYIDIGNVNSNGQIESLQEMLFKNAPSRARRVVRKGDVIISTVRTYLKAITLISSEDKNLIASTGFAVLRAKPNVTSEFLNNVLHTSYFINSVTSNSYGVSYPAITATSLGRLKISIPVNLEEQKRIVEHIKTETRTLDIAISKAEREIELIKEYREAMIAEAVTGKMKL
jgi:type I restriction enzyme, S subunit